ncbi:MAG: right-handed parallel beta-helix repeat-containing protein [Planctomycetota bacterium]
MSPEQFRDALKAQRAPATAIEAVAGLSADHPLLTALAEKKLDKVRVTVPGSVTLYFGSDAGSIVVVASGPDVVDNYAMPSVRGADFVTLDGDAVEPGSPVPAPLVYAPSEFGWRWLESRITLTPLYDVDAEITGADVDESLVKHTLHVRADADRQDADGSTDRPFASLKQAVKQSERLLQRGEGVKIAVHPGLYREGGIEIWSESWSDAARTAPLVMEGVGDGDAVVTGADDWTGGWEPVEGAEGVYRRDWPHRFGLAPQTWDRWGYLIDPRVARSEVVVVEGQIMLPIMLERFAWVDPDGPLLLEDAKASTNVPGQWKAQDIREPGTLLPATFAVVEAEGAIYLCPPEGVDPNEASVEVSVRPTLLTISGRENVVLRNLMFLHAATHIGHPRAVSIRGRDILVEDCVFNEHGANGFGIDGERPERVTLRRSVFNGNGWKGLSVGYRADNYVMEDCETSYNNWRGHTGLQYGWDSAGAKMFAVDGQVGFRLSGHRAFANLTNGFWFDQSFTPRSPMIVEDSYFVGNRFGSQLYLEKLTGPVTVRRNVIWNDDGTRGIDGTSWNVHLKDNILYTSNPGHGALFLHRRGIESEYANYSKDWTMHGNLIASGDGAAPLLQADTSEQQYAEFIETLEADGNVYHALAPDHAFHQAGNFAAWKQQSGQDQGSHTLDPRFADAAAFDWTITNDAVREALPDLPGPLSSEDREKLEYALAQADRFQSITSNLGNDSGPVFDLAKNAIANHFAPLDLSSFANRPLVGEDAWIGAGNALPHLDAGRHVFAGVPFDIPDPADGALVGVALKSNNVHTTLGQPLVDSVEVPLDNTAGAVYVLHGSGWLGESTDPAVVYELVYEDGSTHAVEVQPAVTGVEHPRVGEWYHSFPTFDNADTRHVALQPAGGSPGATLYVLEIANPRPSEYIAAVRLSSVPDQDASVIVLGVTWLQP